MAATPRRSLKRTLASTVEGRGPRFLLGSLVLAMVISLVAGVGIGMKVEKHRIKPKRVVAGVVTKPKKATKAARTAAINAALQAKLPVYAKVVSSRPTALVVATTKRRLTLVSKAAEVQQTAPATMASIVVGSHVLVVQKDKVAKEILVVTGKSAKRLGSTVSAVTATSITVELGTTKKALVTFTTAGAKIETTIAGTKADLVAGRKVIIRTFRSAVAKPKGTKAKKAKAAKTALHAAEVIVLPTGTAFA